MSQAENEGLVIKLEDWDLVPPFIHVVVVVQGEEESEAPGASVGDAVGLGEAVGLGKAAGEPLCVGVAVGVAATSN